MENPLSKRRVYATLLYSMLLISPSVISAAQAVLSGPSQAVAGDLVTLKGQHFEAGATFTIKTLIGKRSSQQLVTAASDGSLSYQLVTASAGKYQLKVLDSRNRLIAESVVQVSPAGD